MDAGPIVVINGDESVRALIQLALEDEGYRVVLADPEGGIAGALREHPALLVIDMDEPRAHARLRGEVPTLRIPVVGLSDAAEAEDAGVDGWLTKPFDLEDLYRTARRWAPRPNHAIESRCK